MAARTTHCVGYGALPRGEPGEVEPSAAARPPPRICTARAAGLVLAGVGAVGFLGAAAGQAARAWRGAAGALRGGRPSWSAAGLFAFPQVTLGGDGFQDGADPFRFQCPLPGFNKTVTANVGGSFHLEIDVQMDESHAPETNASCCAKYSMLQWPFQYPECALFASCPTCAGNDTRTFLHPLLGLVTSSWAASVAVYKQEEAARPRFAVRVFNAFSRHLPTSFMSVLQGGVDPAGVEHAGDSVHRMCGAVQAGLLDMGDVNLCPGVQDWHIEMLNDDTENIHARVYKSPSRKLAFVVFRGTQLASSQNWALDAELSKAPLALGPDGSVAGVHAGFLAEALRVLPRVKKWVDGYIFHLRSIGDDWQVVFTGHSLGGALAILTATIAEAEDWHRKPDATIVFGAPRVGDGGLNGWWQARQMCGRLLRVNVLNDVMHWLPSQALTEWLARDGEAAAFDCLRDLRGCLADAGHAQSGGPSAPFAAGEEWQHVCPESELVVPGRLKGVNPDLKDFSAMGGLLAHRLGNTLYGYGYGVLQGGAAAYDRYCGLGFAGVGDNPDAAPCD